MRLFLILTLVYFVRSQETTEKPLTENPPEVSVTTVPPLVTTVQGGSTTVNSLGTTVPSVATTVNTTVTTTGTTPISSSTGVVETESTTKKSQNGYGDEVVTPPTHASTTHKANREKDTNVVPAKVANRHALFFSGYDKDRSLRARRAAAQNGYGDEPITPAGNPYVEDDYEEGTTTTSTTTAPTTAKKTQNGYGDEAITPSKSDDAYAPQSEQEYAPVEPYAPPAPAVTDGGYKRIRRGSQNGYGDEAVTPSDNGYGSGGNGGGQDEYSPATVSQGEYGEESVQKSGYNRRKRGNEYGDEQVTPSSGGKGSEYESEVEEPYGVQGQNEVTHVPQLTSGY